jgi:pimeloyl-ACP methyl ester carboxylesterase
MRTLTTSDSRILAVEEWGVPGGLPVLYLHGSPMSRLARHPDESIFTALGIQLITYDRPGFGHSTPQPGRSVVDAAADVEAIADALGIERVPVFGVSGGGPHALAVAARLGDRISRVATLASLAPRDAAGLDWTDSMMETNQQSAWVALLGRAAVEQHLSAGGTASRPQLPANDQAVLARPEVGEMLAEAFTEAVRPGLDGWVDDVIALFGVGWGFEPSAISVPTRLWHGLADSVVPPAHSRWLADRIPGAELVLGEGDGHAGHFDATPATLAWLMAGS